jgi:hypothetical protein
MRVRLYDSGWIGTDTLTHASLYLGISMFRDTLRPYCILKKQLDLSGIVYCLERSSGGAEWSVRVNRRATSHMLYSELYQEFPHSEIEWCDIYFPRRIRTEE